MRRLRFFGDSAFHVAVSGPEEARDLSWALGREGWPGIEEMVVGHETLTVIGDPALVSLELLAGHAANLAPSPNGAPTPAIVEIPVTFDGPDLEEVAQRAGMTSDAVAASMTGAELEVEMVGFVPGFAYLVGLPKPLAAIERRPTPRTKVEPGAVGIGGGYAGVYPVSTPGGWQIVGHTSMILFDRETPPFALLHPADRVRIRRVESADRHPPAERGALVVPDAVEHVEVTSPGTLTTVQDLGRIGSAAIGVPRAGPADELSARLANLAAGNPPTAAVLEMTMRGPALRFGADRCVALVGDAAMALDGRQVARCTVHPVAAGQLLEVGPISPGPRAYLAIAGGIESPVVLGSRSSDMLCGLGPGPLRAGDRLALGRASRSRGSFVLPVRSERLRVIRGPDATDELWASVDEQAFEVAPRSDRTGVRLAPGSPLAAPRPVRGSVAMVTGAVQLPPDGNPIVLGVDHATHGGYPVVAVVIRPDLHRIGQLCPGDALRLEPVDVDQADRIRFEAEAGFERAVRGWYPVQAG